MKIFLKIILRFIFVVYIATLFACSQKITVRENKNTRQTENNYKPLINSKLGLNYLLYLPLNYDVKEKLPLLLFLHGAGSKGNDLKLIKQIGLPRLIEDGKDFPFIIVSPQCPENEWWTTQLTSLEMLINNICENYKVDESKIYVTGLSMGGYGTWAIAIKNPNRFAAIIPICGGGDVENICDIGKLPVWTFHGAKDNVVPISETKNLVDKLKSCGGNVEFTIYPNARHDAWTETYNNDKIYEWLLSQSK